MVTLILAVALQGAVSAAAATAPSAFLRYAIDAELQPASYQLAGRTEITWLRRDRPVAELRFQLFLNAWRSAESSWMRSAAERADARLPARWGGIDVLSISLQTTGTPIELVTRSRFIAPDDGNTADRTVLAVDLPEPIGASDTVTVRVQWAATLPSYVGETGGRGRHFFVAHWSPQLCDLDATGWVCPQAYPAERTPAEPADYDVRLGVPENWIVGATGQVTARNGSGNRMTYTFRQQGVRGFAWTASPHFVDVAVQVPKDSPIAVRLLMQPEHRSQVGRFVEAIEESLVEYRGFAPYPYDHLTVVDAAWHTHPGGLGYPALATVRASWLTSNAASDVEADIARGVARQWWGNLVAIDSARDAVTDRALADYAHVRVVDALANRHRQAHAYGFYQQRYFGGFVPWVFSTVRVDGVRDGLKLSSYRAFPTADAPAASGLLGPSALAAVRAKAALAFATLEAYAGWAAIERALIAVAERYAFRRAGRNDVFATMSAAAGDDFSWFFRQTFDGSDTFDYAVSQLESRPRPAEKCRAPCFETTVIVRRLGEAEFTGTSRAPIGPYDAGRALTLLVRFADGSETRDRWDGRARWRLFEYESRAPALSAEIDPDHVLVLDRNLTNNSLTLRPLASQAATRWAARWSIWLQDLLLTYASLV
jgi:hypothetical protein